MCRGTPFGLLQIGLTDLHRAAVIQTAGGGFPALQGPHQDGGLSGALLDTLLHTQTSISPPAGETTKALDVSRTQPQARGPKGLHATASRVRSKPFLPLTSLSLLKIQGPLFLPRFLYGGQARAGHRAYGTPRPGGVPTGHTCAHHQPLAAWETPSAGHRRNGPSACLALVPAHTIPYWALCGPWGALAGSWASDPDPS